VIALYMRVGDVGTGSLEMTDGTEPTKPSTWLSPRQPDDDGRGVHRPERHALRVPPANRPTLALPG
jgi:hypothetical protein